jgi:hypothetical protein
MPCADNALEALPDSLGHCENLVKLQASFNNLKKLPASIGGLAKLELLRVACNCLEEVLLLFRQPAPCMLHAGLVPHTCYSVQEKPSQTCILVYDPASGSKWAVSHSCRCRRSLPAASLSHGCHWQGTHAAQSPHRPGTRFGASRQMPWAWEPHWGREHPGTCLPQTW